MSSVTTLNYRKNPEYENEMNSQSIVVVFMSRIIDPVIN